MERKGICRNVGACSKANKIQIITDDDAEFICTECESELEPVSEKAFNGDEEELKKKKQKKLISLSIIAVVLMAIIGGIFALSSGESKPEAIETAVAPVDSDSIKAAQEAAEQQRIKDSLDAVAAAEAQKQKTEPKPAATPAPAPTPKPAASGSKDLGYATFKGTWPNDVNARMVFKSSHVIDSKDPKKRVAEAGDYVIGEWSEGHLVQGIWYGSDNQVKGSVIIGK
jgi:hypothetical protein